MVQFQLWQGPCSGENIFIVTLTLPHPHIVNHPGPPVVPVSGGIASAGGGEEHQEQGQPQHYQPDRHSDRGNWLLFHSRESHSGRIEYAPQMYFLPQLK